MNFAPPPAFVSNQVPNIRTVTPSQSVAFSVNDQNTSTTDADLSTATTFTFSDGTRTFAANLASPTTIAGPSTQTLTFNAATVDPAFTPAYYAPDVLLIGTNDLEEKALVQQPRLQREGSPFEWINALGIDRALAGIPRNAPLEGASWLRRHTFGQRFRFGLPKGQTVPAGFVPILYNDRQLMAATPEDHRLRVVRFETRQEGTIDYWARAAADEFNNYRGYTSSPVKPFALKNKNLQA